MPGLIFLAIRLKERPVDPSFVAAMSLKVSQMYRTTLSSYVCTFLAHDCFTPRTALCSRTPLEAWELLTMPHLEYFVLSWYMITFKMLQFALSHAIERWPLSVWHISRFSSTFKYRTCSLNWGITSNPHASKGCTETQAFSCHRSRYEAQCTSLDPA